MFFLIIFAHLCVSSVPLASCDGDKRCPFEDEEVIIEKTTFNALTTTDSGGAIYIKSCDVSISDSTFTSCKSTNKGGAIYCEQAKSLAFILKNSEFKDCTSYYGGALFLKQKNQANDEIQSCSFVSCKCTGTGGAVFFQSNGGSIVDSNFTNCEAIYNGGSLAYWNEATGSESGIIQRCHFIFVASLYNPNTLLITTKTENVQPVKIADCCVFAQSGFESIPGAFLIAGETAMVFEGENFLSGDENSIIWPFSGKLEGGKIVFNAQGCGIAPPPPKTETAIPITTTGKTAYSTDNAESDEKAIQDLNNRIKNIKSLTGIVIGIIVGIFVIVSVTLIILIVKALNSYKLKREDEVKQQYDAPLN